LEEVVVVAVIVEAGMEMVKNQSFPYFRLPHLVFLFVMVVYGKQAYL
jgi:hypothetical protein